MAVNQISIFIENKTGTLLSVLQSLKKEGIQLIASTIADTAEYGIFRIICSDAEKAYEVLKKDGIAVSLCEVFAVKLEDKPGMAADTIELFAREGVSIAYLYSFLLGGKGVLIFRPDDAEKTRRIIKENNLCCFEAEDLK